MSGIGTGARMTEEDIVDHYFNSLKDSKHPGFLLTKFYCELFGISLSQYLVPQMEKLVRLYGRENVFFSILEISSNDNLNHDRIYNLLNFICKKRFEFSLNSTTKNLSTLVDETTQRINKLKKDMNK